MTNMQVFGFEGSDIRVLRKDGSLWWIAKDVCEVLGLSNVSDAVSKLDEDEKDVASTDTLGGKQNLLIVNESGLYSLILGSRKTEAKRFKRWVTHDVIPSIRQTGSYSLDSITPSQQLQAILMLDGRQQEFEERIGRIENNTTIDYGQQNDLRNLGNRRIVQLFGGKEAAAYANQTLRRQAFSALWNEFKDRFNVNSRNNTRVGEFEKATEYVRNWALPGKIERQVEDENRQVRMF